MLYFLILLAYYQQQSRNLNLKLDMNVLNTNPELLGQTILLDYESPAIQQLVEQQGWRTIKSSSKRIGAIYSFVRDKILFGYPPSYNQKASEVLALRKGNSITKATLLMALLRSTGIRCRMHASSIDRHIYRGLLRGLSAKLCPRSCFHSWVEVDFKGTWVSLEGLVIDKPYLTKLQERFSDYMGSFHGYGIAVLNFRNPPINWEETDTTIRDKAIKKDIGIFSDPDELFAAHPEIMKWTQSLTYSCILRPRVNKAIKKIRTGK